MVKKSFCNALLGLSLLACMSTPSFADSKHSSIMRVISKAALDGGANVAGKALYIVRNPVGAAKNTLVATKTVIGGAATVVGEVIENAWGYLVDVQKAETGAEGEDKGPTTYIVTAIKDAERKVVDSATELSATLYDAAEPTAYVMQDEYTEYTGNMISGNAPELFMEAYKAVVAPAVEEAAAD